VIVKIEGDPLEFTGIGALVFSVGLISINDCLKFTERALLVLPEREMRSVSITFYTAPAPFDGAEGVQQSLAIHSWLRLDSRPHVVLMGRHPSLRVFAQNLQPHVSVDSEIDITYDSFCLIHLIVAAALHNILYQA